MRANRIDNLVMLPNVTNVSMGIEKRGQLLAHKLKQVSETHNSKVHVICHSFTGVDARAAISMFGASQHVQSLSTVCSPHQGSNLIDCLMNDPGRHSITDVDKVFEAVGLS